MLDYLKNHLGKVLGLSALVVAGVGVVSLVVAYTGGNPSTVIENVQNYNEAPKADAIVGSSEMTRSNENSNFNEIGLISSTNDRVRVEGFVYGSMPAAGTTATTTQYFKNATGSEIFIDTASVMAYFTGTASSSVKFGCGTSTSPGLAAYTTALPSNLINPTVIATSTVGGTNGAGIIQSTSTINNFRLANGEFVVCGWQEPWNVVGCTGATCEAVTSSARGYEATYRFKYWYSKAY